MIDATRVRILKEGEIGKGPVLYWMSRDQRRDDNWALLYAQEKALDLKVPLLVCFCLVPTFLEAPLRAYDFMLRGLEKTEIDLSEMNIPFLLLEGEPEDSISRLEKQYSPSMIITDFDPLRPKQEWKTRVRKTITSIFCEVDAHNIVPCWITSTKREFAARTIRPKIHRLLAQYLVEFPELLPHPFSMKGKFPPNHWEKIRKELKTDPSVAPVSWITPGPDCAMATLERFTTERLDRYPEDRNDPGLEGVSHLSPYLHFGQIAPQRVALETASSKKDRAATEAFLEELVVRRELADNFCFNTPDYDSFTAFPEWARKSLGKHRQDKRYLLYSLEELEEARTHDELWNAGQMEMLVRGKMHGWMRMYWAKKILEWSPSPEEALERAIFLNNRYELDGRDPNGYTGIAWCIGGVHDRAWPSREIFGKVRYMNYKGASRKFDVARYINKIRNLSARTIRG